MRRLRSKKEIEYARKLAEAIEARRTAERLEKELKAHFLEVLGDDPALLAGEYLISTEKRSLTTLDKQALHELLGDKLSDYEKTTEYSVLSVKSV